MPCHFVAYIAEKRKNNNNYRREACMASRDITSNDLGRYFRVYFLGNWIDLDETWQVAGKPGKSDPVEFSVESL